jgi:hypothetical protein
MFESRKAVAAFAAGCFGGIAVNAFSLLFGFLNLPRVIGIDLAPDFNLVDLVSDILWGGVWGLAFLIPLLDGMVTIKGIFIGILSFCVQLLVTISYVHNHAISVHEPLALIAYLLGLNVFWGVIASVCWNSWKDLAR